MLIKNLIIDKTIPKEADADNEVFGIVLNCAFPFPREVQNQYINFVDKINCPELWTMIPESLHVTLATVVAFQNFPSLTKERESLFDKLITDLTTELDQHFTDNIYTPFYLYPEFIGVSDDAGFIQWNNPTEEISMFRNALDKILRLPHIAAAIENTGTRVPSIIHSSIFRYNCEICVDKLLAKIQSGKPEFGKIFIDHISFNTELLPFMKKTECKKKWNF